MDAELKGFVIELGMATGLNTSIGWLDEEEWCDDEKRIAKDYRSAMRQIHNLVQEKFRRETK